MRINGQSWAAAPMRALSQSQLRLRRVNRKLSTGERLTSASVDPAGMGIASRMAARSRSVSVVKRNIRDGLSLLQVADGALSSMTEHIQRIRELAVQACNEILSADDRMALDAEVQERLQELQRIADTTQFNGRKLLRRPVVEIGLVLDTSGSMAGERDNLRAALESFLDSFQDAGNAARLGLAEMNNAKAESVDGVARLLDLGEGDVAAALDALTVPGSAMDPYSALLNTSGANDFAGTAEPDAFSFSEAAYRHLVVITDTGREADFVPAGIADSEADVAQALQDSGVSVHCITPAGRQSTFDDIYNATGGSWHSIGDGTGSGIQAALEAIAAQINGVFGDQGYELQIQAGPDAEASDSIGVGFPRDASLATLGLDGLTLGTRGQANDALAALDGALTVVSDLRAEAGAKMSRLASAVTYHDDTQVSLDAAHARIADADMASESAELAHQEIINTAATSLLARAQRMQRSTAQALVGQMGLGTGGLLSVVA